MSDTDNTVKISLTVNGKEYQINVPPMKRLLDVLRSEIKLTGTKEGCGEGECGACSILLNDELVNSCLIPVIQANGAHITTIEGIASGDKLDGVQKAFIEAGGAQCGFCTPGMILATIYLIRKNPNPTAAEIRTALAGNLCRCTGYQKIFDSVLLACKTSGVKI
ncbi:MAG: ferredoxin [Bdellovibrionales bacterium RIFOXYD1_FULL_44_7]|nr:MAG: ferredoxin [Bdellovibrionales bacterium RIFOXYD1_FULL_44_7]